MVNGLADNCGGDCGCKDCSAARNSNPEGVNQYSGQHGRYKDYHEARGHAQASADKTGNDVAIRATKEFGKKGFNVSFASKNDSDYDRAEIVSPSKPATNEDIGFAAMVSKLKEQGHDDDSANAIAAAIGRAKYGNAGMAKKAAKGRVTNDKDDCIECLEEEGGEECESECDEVDNSARCPKCGADMEDGECTECNYTENANPEGVNQYTGGHHPAAVEAVKKIISRQTQGGKLNRPAPTGEQMEQAGRDQFFNQSNLSKDPETGAKVFKDHKAAGKAIRAAYEAGAHLTANDANFASEQQRRFMWSQHPDIAESWAHGEHSSDKNHKMPEGPGKSVKGPQAKAARKAMKKGTTNSNPQGINQYSGGSFAEKALGNGNKIGVAHTGTHEYRIGQDNAGKYLAMGLRRLPSGKPDVSALGRVKLGTHDTLDKAKSAVIKHAASKGYELTKNAAQPRHPSNGTFQGKPHNAAMRGHMATGYPKPQGLKKAPDEQSSFEDADEELHEDDAPAQLVGKQTTPDGRYVAPVTEAPTPVLESDPRQAGKQARSMEGMTGDFDPSQHERTPMQLFNANPEGVNQYTKGGGGGKKSGNKYTKKIGDVQVTHDEDAGTITLKGATKESTKGLNIHDLLHKGEKLENCDMGKPASNDFHLEDYGATNMIDVAHTGSRQAAAASMEHGPARDHALQALDHSNGGNSGDAAVAHRAAARVHERGALNARKMGQPGVADAHDRAAALHRKAASMHGAVRNAGGGGGDSSETYRTSAPAPGAPSLPQESAKPKINGFGGPPGAGGGPPPGGGAPKPPGGPPGAGAPATPPPFQSPKVVPPPARFTSNDMEDAGDGGDEGETDNAHNPGMMAGNPGAAGQKSQGATPQAAQAGSADAYQHQTGYADQMRASTTNSSQGVLMDRATLLANAASDQDRRLLAGVSQATIDSVFNAMPMALQKFHANKPGRTQQGELRASQQSDSSDSDMSGSSDSDQSGSSDSDMSGSSDSDMQQQNIGEAHSFDGPPVAGKGKSMQAGQSGTRDEYNKTGVKNSQNVVANWLTIVKAPPIVVQAFNEYVENESRQKHAIVQQLVGNIANDAERNRIGNKWMQLGLKSLQEMLHIQPTTNEAIVSEMPANFLGAAGGSAFSPVANVSGGEDPDNALESPTLNWQEISDSNSTSKGRVR